MIRCATIRLRIYLLARIGLVGSHERGFFGELRCRNKSSLCVSEKSSKGEALSLTRLLSRCAAIVSGCFASAAAILACLRSANDA